MQLDFQLLLRENEINLCYLDFRACLSLLQSTKEEAVLPLFAKKNYLLQAARPFLLRKEASFWLFS